ncbi:hypothetical protein Anas_01494 [Armadillidium nasatum]|uniref:Leucine-rich PPR motif-containing protein, mitochondrial n=1 Tax=Armadillidium nasatum TaxID=96803 RepID=A0A5N5TPB4_9CRUS|nr:hypothetical protein Anas_01494 [Armadillidium nasatum]
MFNRMYFTGDLNCIIDEESQLKIDALLTQRMDYGVKNAVLHCIKSNKIPTFKSLLKCSSALSKLGDASTIMYIQNIVKQNFKYLSEKENNLEHYLCEALFRSGNQDKALQCLAALIENCNNVKRVKETTCFLIRMMPQVSEDHQRQLAELLLEKYPELLREREEVVTNIVNKASSQSDHEILQQLIEVLLKYGSKETLSLTISALLKLYCECLENATKAKELVSYAKEREIYLSAESVEQFLNLLVKNKQNSSLSALMIKYGLK